ncbi:hypothetical protein [Actinoplanes subtropicus]|uniref:hypothetical protein n=1 Tax=Actinoplanes subtropicus TaxID=543632 RepID=UPI0004C3F456|nr:hypothetical protein [Actinoplanes subtropicus]
MRRRTLGNGAIIAASLLTLTGLGVAIANAATNSGGASTSAGAGPSAGDSLPESAGPSPTATRTATASPSASSSSGSGDSQCADVFLTDKPAGDSAGKLCTTLDVDGTALSGVTVTFTASSACSGSLMLRVSGIDSSGAEFGKVEKVTCSSEKATASFTPASKIAANTFVCGTLLADKYTAAQACVAVS